MESRLRSIELMRAQIAATGRHVTLVRGGRSPRFAYTVGLTEAGRPELVLAGAAALSADEATLALNELADGFATREVHSTWTRLLLLGALDYYDREDVPALQLVPEAATIDVPDLSLPYDAGREPVWRWLTEEWPFAVSPQSMAMTNLDALQGHVVTEAARWEEGYWELFSGSGPDVPKEEAYLVPLATLLGYDDSLEPVTRLEIGQALWRDYLGPWQPWAA